MSTHHQRLAKCPASPAAHSKLVWVPNAHGARLSGGERTEGIVLASGFSKDLIVFVRRRRVVQRWIPREVLSVRHRGSNG